MTTNALPRPGCLPPALLPHPCRAGLCRGLPAPGGPERWRVPAVRPASFRPSGVVPEDQALYVCEAQNVFGKVQAEARLVVTGHGSLVDLGGRRVWWGGRAPPGRPPHYGSPSFGTGVAVPGSPRADLDPCFLGNVPREVCPLTVEDPLSTGSVGRSGGQWGLSVPAMATRGNLV